jgi:DNA-directed RNA polymerase specialized sigma24 family protein
MANPSEPEPAQTPGARFDTTQWSLVLQARVSGDSPETRRAMACLCSTYWYPLYVFIRRQGHKADAAEDLTQEFFAHFLDRDFLATVDKSRGKFRTFLLACCRHFLANKRDFVWAQKRGGGQPVLSLDFSSAHARYEREPASSGSAEMLFERRWALTLLENVQEQLRQEHQVQDKSGLFDHLRGVLVGETQALSYAQIGIAVGMSEDAVKKAAQRLRRRYALLLREQIAATVDDPAMIEGEIRDLFAALSS